MTLLLATGLEWGPLDTWIVVAGGLSAMSCALLGNFLVLRRMSMMGDAISHAVLPGLAVAFLLTGSRDSVTMLLGAGVVGVLTALFTQWIHGIGRVDEGASMGVVFTILFAIGLILIVRAADSVDLDPGCVLYGAIELVALDTRPVLGLEVPRAVIVLASVFLIDGLVVLLLYKEFKLSSFDPALATTLGINANLMHYVLMCLVAATTVASFESVGSILVIAMLIVPASTAFLLTHRFGPMILLSLVVGAVSAVLGHVSAITVPTWFGFRDTTTAGSMAVVAGLLFLVAFLVAPRRGLVSRIADRFRLALRIVEEDVLGVLYRLEEKRGAGQGALGGRFLREVLRSGPVVTTAAVLSLKRRGRIFAGPDGYQLSATGRAAAARVVRSHRLWESYLDEVLAQPADHVHTAADRMEHYIPWSLQREISNELADAARDPHGQPIPRRDEDDSAPAGGP